MARFRSSIDLGQFLGARYIAQSFTEGGPVIKGIFIPVGINGIDVLKDARDESKKNRSGFRAFINFQQRYCNNKYIEAIKQKFMREQKEVTAYNIPSHQMCYVLSEEKRNKIRSALEKMLKVQNKDYAQQSDASTESDMHKAISRMMPFHMGDCYLMEEQRASVPVASNTPVAQQVANYAPVQQDPFSMDSMPGDDDLPF